MRTTNIAVLLLGLIVVGCAGSAASPKDTPTDNASDIAKARPTESEHLHATLQPGWMRVFTFEGYGDGADMTMRRGDAEVEVHLLKGEADQAAILAVIDKHVPTSTTDLRPVRTSPEMKYAVSYQVGSEGGVIFVRRLSPEVVAVVMSRWHAEPKDFDPVIEAFAFTLSLRMKDWE